MADYMVVATTSYLRLYPTESLQACTAVSRFPDCTSATALPPAAEQRLLT